jgi:hypothetical protein
MGSENREVREKQLAKALAAFDARKALLSGNGLDDKAAGRDPVLKNLRAELKKARARIKAMDAAAAHVVAMAATDTKVKKEEAKGAKAKTAKAKGKEQAPDKKAAKPKKK